MFVESKFTDLVNQSIISQVRQHHLESNNRRRDLEFFLTLEIKFKCKLGRKLGYALTQIRNRMITKMNHLSDKVIEYQREVMNMLLTFDILQSQLKLSHIQTCCFEDFEYIYKQALFKSTVRS